MTPLDLIRAAANDGVYLIRSSENLNVVGLTTRVKTWAPRLRRVKPQLLEIASVSSGSASTELVTTQPLMDALQEACQERAAIMHFDGGLPNDLAERLAMASVYGPYSIAPRAGPNLVQVASHQPERRVA